MKPTGHLPPTLLAVIALWPAPASTAQETPTATPVPPRREQRLADYARRNRLERPAAEPDGDPLVITNDTVDRLADHGVLTSCTPRARASPAMPRPTPVPASRRAHWRRQVEAQRARIARTTDELARIDARIDSLEDAAFDGGSKAYRLWAKVDEAKRQRQVVERRLDREQSELSAIVRAARREGAEPGWFR